MVIALAVSACLAVYPGSQPGASGFWFAVDYALLVMGLRGHRRALSLLTWLMLFGAGLWLWTACSN